LLVLFLIHHDENIRDFIGSNGVSMLEFLLRTKAILIEVDECDELITKICALAKVQGNQQQKLYRNKSNRNLHRHVLRRILFNFNIWQRSSKPVQQRIMRLLIQALDENPVTISRTVGAQIFLDSCRDAYPTSSGGSTTSSPSSAHGSDRASDALSPGKAFRDDVFRMLRVVLSHNTEKDDVEAVMRFLVNCRKAKTLRGGLTLFLKLLLDEPIAESNKNIAQVIDSVFNHKDSKRLLFPLFMIQRLGEYKDTKARCLALHVLTAYVSYYTTPSKKNGATSSNVVGGGLTKKYSFRNIMSDGNSKSLPQLLYEKGVYHLLYQNFSRQELNHNVEDIYYDSLLSFLLCNSRVAKQRNRVRAMSFNLDENAVIIDDKQVIHNPQGWCVFLKVLNTAPNSMQARALQDFLLLLTYNPTNRKEMLHQANWQWAFYPMFSEAFSNSEKFRQGKYGQGGDKNKNKGQDDEVLFQDTYPISLKLIRILLFHACNNEKTGWNHLEQFIVMSNFSKNGHGINQQIMIGLLDQIEAEITTQLKNNLYWPFGIDSNSPSNYYNSGSSESPLIMQNLIGIANIIEHFVLSSSSSLDGKAVASKDNISTRSTRSESDFVVIDKSSQKDNNCDGGATSNSEDNVDQEQFLLQEQNNLLVTKLLSIYDNILYSVGDRANNVLWQRCLDLSSEEHPCNNRGPLILILLRLSVFLLKNGAPCSEDARVNAERLGVLVSSLMWGINSNKVRSPSSSIDVFEGVVGIGSGNNGRESTKSLSDISSVADLLGSLGTGRSLRSENNRANQRRRHSNSFESNSAMGMYMLDEEEQWAMVLIREIKFALIEIRNVIFGRDNSSGSKSNPSSPKNIVNREESSNSLTLADKVSALTFNGEVRNEINQMMRANQDEDKTKKKFTEKPEGDTLRKVELAAAFCDSLLRTLTDIVNGTQDILEDYLKNEQKHSLLQLVEMHQSKNRQDLLTLSHVKRVSADDQDSSSSTSRSTRDAVNMAIDKLMNWVYAPWLIVPIDETPGNGNDVAIYTLSEEERSYWLEVENYYDYKWQQYMMWELEWSQPKVAKVLSDRVRQMDNTLGYKEVNRRAALAATEDDHFADAGRKWVELSDKLHFGDVFGPEDFASRDIHWMVSQREDALRRRRLLCPNANFDQHLDCKYGYQERKAYEEEQKQLQLQQHQQKQQREESLSTPVSINNKGTGRIETKKSSSTSATAPPHTPSIFKMEDGASLLTFTNKKQQQNFLTPARGISDQIDDMSLKTPALSAVKIKRDPSQGMPDDYNADEDNEFNALKVNDDRSIDNDTMKNKQPLPLENDYNNECSEDEENYEMENNIPTFQQNMFSLHSGEEIVFSAIGVVWVTPLSVVRGRLDISNLHLFFYPSPADVQTSSNSVLDKSSESTRHISIYSAERKTMRWMLRDLRHVFSRRYLLRSNAMEFFFNDKTNIFLSFEQYEDKEMAWNNISRVAPPSLDFRIPTTLSGGATTNTSTAQILRGKAASRLGRRKSLTTYKPWQVLKRSGLTERWRRREMTNFEYLMHLNTIAGRSYNDITQYPIFPWVIADYGSETIDLNNPKTYRDLSKPVGALNEDRLAQFIERYEMFDGDGIPKFHYGSHYSSAGVVLHYLLRLEPFTSLAIALQSGKFDCPDRLFSSISECWHSCLNSMSDVKELIPEFFCMPEFLINSDKFPLGSRQDGKIVDDVELPPWAANPHEFIRINAAALESEYVSQNLHLWVDLIFGYKQNGPEAEKAHNLFYYLTYEGAVDLDSITDPIDRAAAESQIAHFGQTPSQLLRKAHPKRMPFQRLNFLVYPAGSRVNFDDFQFVTKIPVLQQNSNSSMNLPSITFLKAYGEDKIITIYSDYTIATHKLSLQQQRKNDQTSSRQFKVELQRRRLITGSQERSCLWNSREWWSRARPGVFAMPLNGPKRGRLIASIANTDNTIKFHTLQGQLLQSTVDHMNHKDIITCLEVCEDGMAFVTGSLDCTVRVWKVFGSGDAQTSYNDLIDTLEGMEESNGRNAAAKWLHLAIIITAHKRPIRCLAASSMLDIIVSSSDDGKIYMHNISDGSRIRCFLYPDSCLPDLISLSKAGDIILLSNEDHSLYVYSINGALISKSRTSPSNVSIIQTTADARYIISGSEDGIVTIRYLNTLEIFKIHQILGHGAIRCFDLVSDFLLCGMEDGILVMMDSIVKYDKTPINEILGSSTESFSKNTMQVHADNNANDNIVANVDDHELVVDDELLECV
jgi:WD40 repeat protein